MGVRGFPFAKASSNPPHFRFRIFVPFDELSGESKAFADGDLEVRYAVVVADEVGGNTGFVKVEVLIFTSLQGGLQTIFGVVNASAHSCAVSFPGELAEFDGGNEAGDNLSEAFGRDFVVGGQGGKDGVRRHGGVVVEDDGRGIGIDNDLDGVGAGRRDGVVDAVIGHAWTKVLDEVLEVVGEPGIWSEDEGGSGLE